SPPGNEMEQGQAMYRSNCAFCHGLTGLGGRGPDLVTHRKPDADIKRIIKEGVPGTTMPSFGGFEPEELNRIVAFITHLSGSAPEGEKIAGDSARGKQIYAKNGCANCHVIGVEGSTYGPELTRVGGARAVRYLKESIANPSADVPPEYAGVTVVTNDGKRVQGVRVNQDSFTVQLRMPSQQFRSFIIGKDAKEFVDEKKSLMPAYAGMAASDLEDLVAYLSTLRANASMTGGQTKQAEGIK
ncbi:MAG: c-type cytochrome, partial [Bryobacteraceae bacterium]|nr:c-type cytochrome [Bryobacteraceae bacterium]